MVLVIELENALTHMHTTVEPSKMWSPYRQPLAKFLNKYTVEVTDCGHSLQQNGARADLTCFSGRTRRNVICLQQYCLASGPTHRYRAQAVEYFLETSRMANTSYFHRFVDIVRSPVGKPLLVQLAASDRKLGELLAYPSVLPAPVPGAPETPQASHLPPALARSCKDTAKVGHIGSCLDSKATRTEVRRPGISSGKSTPKVLSLHSHHA